MRGYFQSVQCIAFALWVSTGGIENVSGRELPAPTTDRLAVLDQLSDQVVQYDSYYGRKRLVISSGKIVVMDFIADQPALHKFANADTRSLEYLIRAKALQRDVKASFPEATFWVEPLNRIRESIKDLEALSNGEGNAQSRMTTDKVDEQFRSLQRMTTDYAEMHNVGTQGAREPAVPYEVTVQIEDPKPRVRFMTLLSYLRAKAFNSPLDDQWLDLGEGKRQLIGKYRYHAEWPKEFGGPTESTFEVDKDAVITFRPTKR